MKIINQQHKREEEIPEKSIRVEMKEQQPASQSRQTDKQTDKKTDKQTDKQTDRGDGRCGGASTLTRRIMQYLFI